MKNIFKNLPDALGTETFEILAKNSDVTIERIISSGQTSPETGWYDQEQDEWVIVLQGSAEITFDDGTVAELQPGDYLNIPAHKKHKVTKTSTEPKTIWLAVHY